MVAGLIAESADGHEGRLSKVTIREQSEQDSITVIHTRHRAIQRKTQAQSFNSFTAYFSLA
jgi:hypothetical protein